MKIPPRFRASGFTLVELLIVMAIMGILAALSLTAFSAGGAPLDTGVARVMNTLTVARSEAIARNTAIQLRIIVNDSGDATTAGRVFSLFERSKDGTGAFKQLTPWDRLPDTISMLQNDTGLVIPTALPAGTNILGEPSSGNSTNNFVGGVPFQKRQVNTLVVEFSPTGALSKPTPAQANSFIFLASTVPSSPSPAIDGTVTLGARTNEVKNKNNWRQIRLSNLTGQQRMSAPGAY